MNEEIYNLAAQSGATDEAGKCIKESDVICFTRTEFEGFLNRLAEFQSEKLMEFAERNTGSVDSPPELIINCSMNTLRIIMGVN